MIKKAAVIGAGSWGTAVSIAIADRGLSVTTYGKDPKLVEEINRDHCNSKYLPGISLPENIRATNRLEDVADSPVIFLVVPSQVTRSVLEQLREIGVPKETIIVSCSKGIDPSSGKLMHPVRAMPRKSPERNRLLP